MSLRGFGQVLKFGGPDYFVCYLLEVHTRTLAGPFCFHSKISPGTALSKMDPTCTDLPKKCVVCSQVLAGCTVKYGGETVVWLVDWLFGWVGWLFGWFHLI